MKHLLILLLSLSVHFLTAQTTGLEEQLSQLAAEIVDADDLPGMTLAVTLPDGQVLSVAAGLADVEAGAGHAGGSADVQRQCG